MLIQIGNTSVNTSSLTVTWPNNSFKSWCANANTAQKVASINATITKCGYLKEPSGGVLPAYAKVYIFTSEDFTVGSNSFVNLTDTAYAIFQCSGNTSGHFANYGSPYGTRTTVLKVSGKCNDTLTYDRALLKKSNGSVGAEDGGYVLSDYAGNLTYKNDGCVVPLEEIGAKITSVSKSQFCPGDSIKMTGATKGGICYVWRSADGKFSDSLASTTYFFPSKASAKAVFYVFGNCGYVLDSTRVKSLTKPTVYAGKDTATCASSIGFKAVTNPSSGVNVNWITSGAGSFSPSNTAATTYLAGGNDTGTLKIIAIANDGCFTVKDTLKLTFKSGKIIVNAGKDTTVCGNNPINLSGKSSTQNHKWKMSGGSGSIVKDTALNTQYISGTQDSVVTFVLTATGACGSASDTLKAFFITLPKPNFNFADNNPCPDGDTIALLDDGNKGLFKGSNYLYANKGFIAAQSGSYKIWYVIQKQICKDSVAKTIVVKQKINKAVFAGKDTFICGTGLIHLNGTGGQSPYKWKCSGSGIISNDTLKNTFYKNQNMADTVLHFVLTATGICGSSSDTFTAHISKNLSPNFTLSDSIVCVKSDSIVFYPDAYKGKFYGLNLSATPAWYPSVAGTFPVIYKVNNGVCRDSVSRKIIVNALPDPGFSITPGGYMTVGKQLTFLPKVTKAQHDWYVNNSAVSPSNYKINSTKKFYVLHEITDTTTGCSDTTGQWVGVEEDEELFISNVFTPNEDSLNDRFYVAGVNIAKVYLLIYNRWGEKLFETKELDHGWDGKVKSAYCPEGVYFYLVKATGKSGKNYEFKGTLTLIR